jgi:hypothetical protein
MKELWDDIRYNDVRYAKAFPPCPEKSSARFKHEEGFWRLQCFLGCAEMRYAQYLHFLNKWAIDQVAKGIKGKYEWPLPPW